MPKLNVQQNNQNVIQAFKNALAIGNLKGIIASDGNHNFSTAGSNRNLLDNPFFTVNQRGVNGTITNGQYGLDRWMAGGGTVTMATGGITLGAGNSYALQRPANKEIFNGKTVTMSVMTDDGVIESGTVVAQTGAAKTVRTANFELCIGYTANGSFYFYNTSASAKTVIAVKLELGSVSTLANDAPPDYETELDHCRKYFYRIKAETTFGIFGNGFCSGGNAAYVIIPINMRKTPTSGSTSGAFRLMVGAGVTTGVTVTYSSNSNSHMARFDVSQSGSSWTAGGSCILSAHSDTNAYIDLNADL